MTTTQLAPIKRGISHGRFSYPKKKKDLGKEIPIFAYLRRSTTNKQEVSLENQADNIDLIIKKYKLDKDKVQYFRESHSAFENRKREEFQKMLYEIDRLETPCILLVRDPSRLSRNPKDSLEIANRLFGDNKAKKNIAKIVFFEDGEWDTNSDKREVTQAMLNSYHESITTGKRSKNGVNAKLARGEYIHRNPKGLEKIKVGGMSHLKESHLMPFIRRAFEMKMAGSTHKKITAYLADHGIKKGERYLTDEIFANTVYIGTYIDKKTGQIFENLLFFEGKPPISMALWEGVQENRGKKKDNYGDRQVNFTLGEVLRTEKGHRLSGYFKKGTVQYKNNIEGIHISEKWVIKEYLKFLRDAIFDRTLKSYLELSVQSGVIAETDIEFWTAVGKKFFSESHDPNSWYSHIKKSLLGKEDEKLSKKDEARIKDEISSVGEEIGAPPEESFLAISKLFEVFFGLGLKAGVIFADYISTVTGLFEENNHESRKLMDEKISAFEKEKVKIEEENKQAMMNFLKLGNIEGMETILQEALDQGKTRMAILNEQISEFKQNGDFDLFCKKIPGLLQKTFELSEKVLTNKKNENLKEDIYDIIKLTTFELRVKKKKTLDIELFGPVRQVLFGNDNCLEAPPGVEPGYEALQAPV